MYGGYMEKGESAYTWTTGALPPYENRFFLVLNYKITEERLKEILTFCESMSKQSTNSPA